MPSRGACPRLPGVQFADVGIQRHPHPRGRSGAFAAGKNTRPLKGLRPSRTASSRRRGRSPGAPAAGRKPAWLRAPLGVGAEYAAVKRIVREHRLSTVCEEAKCPNIGECWNAGTATIMLMGAVCTRACRFCAVDTGNPRGWLDPEEPENVARSVELMGLKYVVLTSVDRDDLADGGAAHYAAAIRAIKRRNPEHGGRSADAGFPGCDTRCANRRLLRIGCVRAECRNRRAFDPSGARPARRLSADSRCARGREAASTGRADEDEPHAGPGRNGC